ncbi:MAG TPA: hypothetical protein DEO83_03940, partial [Lachnospiraceae bacterium]|nr:hypothetical protein [Lachnospiraceae bacterium]
MILKYKLPPKTEALVETTGDERIYYSVPVDIDTAGNLTEDSYLVVTTRNVYVIRGEKKEQYKIKDLKEVHAELGIGGGLLTARYKDMDMVLVHYSSKHMSRYAYVARGINILISGRYEEVISNEYEKICPKCGRVIPGTKQCPKCSKEGRFLSVFVRMAKPYKKEFFGVFFLMILAAVTTLLNPEVQKHLINDVLKEGGRMRDALIYLAMMFSLSVGIVIVNILKSNSSARLGARIAEDLRIQLFKKYQQLPLEFINDRRPGELLNRIINDTVFIRQFMEDVFCNLFAVFFIFIWDIIFMMILNLKLALLTFICVPIVSVIMLSLRKTIHRIFHLQFKKNDDVSSDLQDVISGMRVVKTYGKEKEESDRFKVLSTAFANIQKRNERFWAMFDLVLSFFMGMGVVIVVYFGGTDVFAGKMSAGELYQFISYTMLLFQYISWLGRLPQELSRLTSSLERVYDVLAQSIEEESADVHDIDIKGEVVFDHATFGYKSYSPVLEDINAVIKPGEMIGIVGASGTGKSTLINLLMGLYKIDDGRL